MNSIKETISKVLDHNVFMFMALVVIAVIGILEIGCQPTVDSPITPGDKVTRSELNADVEHLTAEIEMAYENLAQQELFRQKLFEIGLAYAQTGGINPIGAGVTLLSILGIGAVGDNLRKNTVIKVQKNQLAQLAVKEKVNDTQG